MARRKRSFSFDLTPSQTRSTPTQPQNNGGGTSFDFTPQAPRRIVYNSVANRPSLTPAHPMSRQQIHDIVSSSTPTFKPTLPWAAHSVYNPTVPKYNPVKFSMNQVDDSNAGPLVKASRYGFNNVLGGLFKRFGWLNNNTKQPVTPGEKAASFVGEQVASAPLWMAGEAAVGKLAGAIAPKIAPKILPAVQRFVPKFSTPIVPAAKKVGNIVKGGLKDASVYGGIVAPAETLANGDGLKGLIEREKAVPSVALGGMAFRGVGAGLGKLADSVASRRGKLALPNAPLPTNVNPTVAAPKIVTQNTNPFNFSPGRLTALNNLKEGLKAVRDYTGSADPLSAYPPGTPAKEVYADIKNATGVDLPQLNRDYQTAHNTDLAQKQGISPDTVGPNASGIVDRAKVPGSKVMAANIEKPETYSISIPLPKQGRAVVPIKLR